MNESINKKSERVYKKKIIILQQKWKKITILYLQFHNLWEDIPFFLLYFLEIVSALILVWYKVAILGSGANERKVSILRDERPLGSSVGKDS